MEVFVSDEQTDVEVESVRWQTLASRVLEAEGVRGQAEMALLFVSREAMHEMNRVHMGVDSPTDVLAFPIDLPCDRSDSALGNTGVGQGGCGRVAAPGG